MFEKIVIRRSSNGDRITAGQIAEALLFYQNVHLALDRASLEDLVTQIGPHALLSILRRPGCTGVFSESLLAAQHVNVEGVDTYSFASFIFPAKDHEGASQKDRIGSSLRTNGGLTRAEANRFLRDFFDLVPNRELTSDFYITGGVLNAARQDLTDPVYARESINVLLENTPGGRSMGDALNLEILDNHPNGFTVSSNIDFDVINRRRAGMSPAPPELTISNFLADLLEARADVAVASFYGGDLGTSDNSLAILRIKYAELLRRTGVNNDQLSAFQEIIFKDFPSIRQVIDSRQRTFKEMLILLDKTERFKEWVNSTTPDEGLIRAYIDGIRKEDWVSKVPSKIIRYMLTTVAGLAANPVIGLAACAFDTFLLEKILAGWRPNHFVERSLVPFVEKS